MKLKDRLHRSTTRDSTPRGYVPRGVRTTGIAVTSLIALGTAIVSYNHALDVIRQVGVHGRIAYLIPLFADGLIFLCSIALFAATAAEASCWWAWSGLVIGVGVTVTMNVVAGVAAADTRWGRIGGALVGALTPVVLFWSLNVLEWLLRLQVAPAAVNCPHGLPATVADAAAADFLHRRDCLAQEPTYAAVASWWGVDRRRLPDLVAAMSAELDPAPERVAGDPEPVAAAPDRELAGSVA